MSLQITPDPNPDWSAFLNLPEAGSKLVPFVAEPQPLKDAWELRKILTEIFDAESARLGLKPERYEYSCIKDFYSARNPVWETHYFIYDPGPGLMRGILGNLLGPELKEKMGVDVGSVFENISFTFAEVLPVFPGVDVPGYGPLHTFSNVLNSRLLRHNMVLGYLRQEDDASFRHGYDDHIGLLTLIPGEGQGEITAGDVEMYPVQDVEGMRLHEVSVTGGKLVIAPLASCSWNLNYIDDFSDEDFLKAAADEVPVRDREVDTFHYLNGYTPHQMKRELVEACERIDRYKKPV